MTGAEYRALRKRLGTQTRAAELLHVSVETVRRRERSESVHPEAGYALRWVSRHLETRPSWQMPAEQDREA